MIFIKMIKATNRVDPNTLIHEALVLDLLLLLTLRNDRITGASDFKHDKTKYK